MSDYAGRKLLYHLVSGSSETAVIGRAVRIHSGWLLTRRNGGRNQKVGFAPAACPSPVALGAARLLLWPRDDSLGVWRVRNASGASRLTIWGAQNIPYGSDFGAATGLGATFWNRSSGTQRTSIFGQLSHQMTENGAAADEWVVWGFPWHNQGVVDRVSDDLFTVTDYSVDPAFVTRRIVRSGSGPWRLQAPWGTPQWKTLATVPRSCPGAWAAGVAVWAAAGE
jgi:hypothetical protein